MPTLFDLPTPSLILDRAKLIRNIQRMGDAATANGVMLRPHLKTAKSIDIARLATEGQHGGIAVSTLKEAEYFASHGVRDILYAVCVVPDKLERVAAIQNSGTRVTLITDSSQVARAIADKARELDKPLVVQAEIDSGEGRTGVAPDSEELLDIARIIDAGSNSVFDGVITHAGHSYQCRSVEEIAAVAEEERLAAVTAARRVREAAISCDTLSVGSTPTALHARSHADITEVRAGVYMFGDMFQAQIHSCAIDDLAISVLSEVISHQHSRGQVVVDAGALALSQDRSTAKVDQDVGYGRVDTIRGEPFKTPLNVARVHQEHGQVPLTGPLTFSDLPIGSRVRIYPNHACITAAMHDRYYVIDSDSSDGNQIIATWPRINGW